MPLHFPSGARAGAAPGGGGQGGVQVCLRSGGGGRGGGPRRYPGDGPCSMSSYDMVRLSADEDVTGLPENFPGIG
ncbi:hypothetical protein C6Q17_39270 [Burkholderia contaminans]|nr:hypothetical protein C6Q17_39270 [Burkholderia contaminans]